MVAGFLVIGILAGLLTGEVALAFGHALWVAGLAYMLGGMLGMSLGLAWGFLWTLVARQIDFRRQHQSDHIHKHE